MVKLTQSVRYPTLLSALILINENISQQNSFVIELKTLIKNLFTVKPPYGSYILLNNISPDNHLFDYEKLLSEVIDFHDRYPIVKPFTFNTVYYHIYYRYSHANLVGIQDNPTNIYSFLWKCIDSARRLTSVKYKDIDEETNKWIYEAIDHKVITDDRVINLVSKSTIRPTFYEGIIHNDERDYETPIMCRCVALGYFETFKYFYDKYKYMLVSNEEYTKDCYKSRYMHINANVLLHNYQQIIKQPHNMPYSVSKIFTEIHEKFDEKYIEEQKKLNDDLKNDLKDDQKDDLKDDQKDDLNVSLQSVDVNEFEQLKKKVNDLENVVKNLLEILNN
jgi:hypothetical protein